MSTRLATAATLVLLVLARHRLVDVWHDVTRGIAGWQVEAWGTLVAGGVLVGLMGVGVVLWVGSAIEERKT